ncbi:Protein shuttle craft [Orchesella cincta]|uniref:Protein shuttle craft n=1 Tax=Orchesella cincta TaxID=48709 RepID=A0A1D2NHE9_ORCCI|nr:Protein shuttle craft [Orchesella cincta]
MSHLSDLTTESPQDDPQSRSNFSTSDTGERWDVRESYVPRGLPSNRRGGRSQNYRTERGDHHRRQGFSNSNSNNRGHFSSTEQNAYRGNSQKRRGRGRYNQGRDYDDGAGAAHTAREFGDGNRVTNRDEGPNDFERNASYYGDRGGRTESHRRGFDGRQERQRSNGGSGSARGRPRNDRNRFGSDADPNPSTSTLNPNAESFQPNSQSSGVVESSQRPNVNFVDRAEMNHSKSESYGNRNRRRQHNNDYAGKKFDYSHNRNSRTGFSEENELAKLSEVAHESGDVRNKENSRIPSASGGSTKLKNQREVLMDQLSRNSYECMVCCEKVRYSQSVWSCKRCFNVFHLSCIRKWASSSADAADSGWRCPGCQSYCDSSPDGYYCFCGKMKNPKSSRYDVPHTCGQVCGKANPGGLNCIHNCTSPCHPGPCPTCEVQQTRYCGCGKTNAQVLCGSKVVLKCDSVCNKTLPCEIHHCIDICHFGKCTPCDKKLTHECYCRSDKKEVQCTKQNNNCKEYSCSKTCGKQLGCGKHLCEKICHSGPCGPCNTAPEAVLSCPCGQTAISEACTISGIRTRVKCTDPIPTCRKICSRILPCGDTNDKHKCQLKCHLNKCPPCTLVSHLKCRCGSKILEVACKELSTHEDFTCQKKCNKKRSCGKHKCNGKCCIDMDHICPIVCQRQLRCGKHTCTNLCHLNPCPPCPIVSFDELPCECGAAIIYPPVPCGTRPPPCHLPCSRQHSHGHHRVTRSLTVLLLRKTIMCYITEVSCGLQCGKMLPCNRHSCPKICHGGSCLNAGETCKLPCSKPRFCRHPCGVPCHEDKCPDTKCKIMTDVACPCGRRCDTLICWRREIEYDRTVTWEYHKELKKLEETKNGSETIDDSMKQEIIEKLKERIPKSAVLECDKECARLERNRKLAEALQVDNADVTTSIGTPNYSEFLMQFAKKNPQFIETVHKQLTDLVMKAKQSRKKNETYGFNSMNRDKRHVIHEYSDFFGVLSESFDEEPNRNVVCFASKEKSYLPSVSLIDAAYRPVVRSGRLKPNDDVVFLPEKRTQIVRPSNSNWTTATKAAKSSNQPIQRETMNLGTSSSSSTFTGSKDFPPL